MQIFDIACDCVNVLCQNLFQSTGDKSMGCIFHDPRRQSESRKLYTGTDYSITDPGWHVCTGTLFLQIFMPDGSNLFTASGTAGLLAEKRQTFLHS